MNVTHGNKLPGLLLPAEWSAMLLSLDDATLSALIRAAIRYANSDGHDGQDGQDGRAGTEAMGLKAKAAPLWMIMRAEINRQIQHHGRVSAGARKAASVRWSTTKCERIRTHANAYERMRTHNPDNPAPENADSGSRKQRNDNDIIRTHAIACERMRSDTRVGGRAGGEGTVLSSTSSLSEKENLQKKAGADEANEANGANVADGKTDLPSPSRRLDKQARKERIVRILMHYIRRHYHRRKTTAWSSKEMSQVRTISARPDVIRELRVIGRAYRGGYQYARHDIITLLNNWTTELDRSAKYNAANKGRRTINGSSITTRYGMQ